jgi:hypothetical protein
MKKEKTLEDLKNFMVANLEAHVSDVDDWNAVRELAKDKFPSHLIAELDASAFIKTLHLRKNQAY